MDAVIKVGGSLAKKPLILTTLGNKLDELSKKHSLTVVPGGSKFADVVREFDHKYTLSSYATHKMAILGMDQFGLLLSQIIHCSYTTYSLRDAKQFSEDKTVPIILPTELLFKEAPFEPSWDVTSDSIAAYVASRLNAVKLLLVKDVDGIFTSNPKNHSDAKLIPEISPRKLLTSAQRTCVDKFLPKLLLKEDLECYVVNGAYPSRVEAILAGQNTVCTLIKA